MKQEYLLDQRDRQIESWKKILINLRQQNIAQKTRLAEMLKHNNDKNKGMLEKAEEYQNRLLQLDETVRLMSNDIADYEKLSVKIPLSGKTHLKQTTGVSNKLKIEIKNLEDNFSKLQMDFKRFFPSKNYNGA